jgi:hypothetical protein
LVNASPPPFSSEYFAFFLAIQKCKNQSTENYNFPCSFVWVRNPVSHIKEIKEKKILPERDAVEDIWV